MQQQRQEPCFPLVHLPKEVQRRLVSFLGPRDALNLSQTCKTLHANVAVSILQPSIASLTSFNGGGLADHGDTVVHRAFRLPVCNKNVKAHTICLDCTWRDNGASQQYNAEAWIAEFSSQMTIPDKGSFGEGRIVAHGRLVSPQRERLHMEFSPKDEMSYHFYYKGGGRRGNYAYLHFISGDIHALMYDDPSHSISRNYKALLDNGALPTVKFHSVYTDVVNGGARCQISPTVSGAGTTASSQFIPEMLLAACQLLLRQNSQAEENCGIMSPELVAVFAKFRIPLHRSSLRSMEAWLQQGMEWREMYAPSHHADNI